MRTRIVIMLLIVALIGTTAGWIATGLVLSAKAERYRTEAEQYRQRVEAMEEAERKAREDAMEGLRLAEERYQEAQEATEQFLQRKWANIIHPAPVGDDGK
jgi:hypothetical protein